MDKFLKRKEKPAHADEAPAAKQPSLGYTSKGLGAGRGEAGPSIPISASSTKAAPLSHCPPQALISWNCNSLKLRVDRSEIGEQTSA